MRQCNKILQIFVNFILLSHSNNGCKVSRELEFQLGNEVGEKVIVKKAKFKIYEDISITYQAIKLCEFCSVSTTDCEGIIQYLHQNSDSISTIQINDKTRYEHCIKHQLYQRLSSIFINSWLILDPSYKHSYMNNPLSIFSSSFYDGKTSDPLISIKVCETFQIHPSELKELVVSSAASIDSFYQKFFIQNKDLNHKNKNMKNLFSHLNQIFNPTYNNDSGDDKEILLQQYLNIESLCDSNYNSSDDATDQDIIHIWVYWDKGFDAMSDILKHIAIMNYYTIHDMNDDYSNREFKVEYHFVSNKNLDRYIDISSLHPYIQSHLLLTGHNDALAAKFLKPEQISDYIRLALLYEHGGLYIDTDYLLLSTLSSSTVSPLLESLSALYQYVKLQQSATDSSEQGGGGVIFIEEYHDKIGNSFILGDKHGSVIADLLNTYHDRLDVAVERYNRLGYHYLFRDTFGSQVMEHVISKHKLLFPNHQQLYLSTGLTSETCSDNQSGACNVTNSKSTHALSVANLFKMSPCISVIPAYVTTDSLNVVRWDKEPITKNHLWFKNSSVEAENHVTMITKTSFFQSFPMVALWTLDKYDLLYETIFYNHYSIFNHLLYHVQ